MSASGEFEPIPESLDDLEAIYHLAARGVEISYNGYSGNALAGEAAASIAVDHDKELGVRLCTNTLWRQYEQYAEPTDVLQALDYYNMALDLYDLQEIGLEDLIIAYGVAHEHATNSIPFMYEPNEAMNQYDATGWGLINSLRALNDLFEGAARLKKRGLPEIEEDMAGFLEQMIVTCHVLAEKIPREAMYAYTYANGVQKLAESYEIDVTPAVSWLWQAMSDRYKHARTPQERAAAIHAAADLFELKPDDPRTRGQVVVMSNSYFWKALRNKDVTDQEEMAYQRVRGHGWMGAADQLAMLGAAEYRL